MAWHIAPVPRGHEVNHISPRVSDGPEPEPEPRLAELGPIPLAGYSAPGSGGLEGPNSPGDDSDASHGWPVMAADLPLSILPVFPVLPVSIKACARPAPDDVHEMVRLYQEVYGPGLAGLLEATWFADVSPTHGAVTPTRMLRRNRPLLALLHVFLRAIRTITSTDPADMAHARLLETRIVWGLAKLVPGPDTRPLEEDAVLAQDRVAALEALLAGTTLPTNPPAPSPNKPDFWFYLARYLAWAPSASPASTGNNDNNNNKAREDCLGQMRSLLDGRENRDVLYSMAVLREYAPVFNAALTEQSQTRQLPDEADARGRLAVATRFIRDQSASMCGTTNVVRCVCDLAYQAYVRPGYLVKATGSREEEEHRTITPTRQVPA